MPEFNVRVAGYEVDCLWRAERLVVELDGYAFHHTDLAAARDQVKDEALVAAGYEVLHFTYRQVVERPDWVVEQITGALERPRARVSASA